MSELYLPNELYELIYKQSIWLLIGDKKRLFKYIHQSIKDKYTEKERRAQWDNAFYCSVRPFLGGCILSI